MCLRQIDRQAPHHPQPSLRKVHRACQRQFASIACQAGLAVLRTIGQLVEAQAFSLPAKGTTQQMVPLGAKPSAAIPG